MINDNMIVTVMIMMMAKVIIRMNGCLLHGQS